MQNFVSLHRLIHMIKFFLFLAGMFLISLSCIKKSNDAKEPVLLFKSGFENDVYIDPTAYTDSEDYRFIRGTDRETGFSWPVEILGATESALHFIDDDNHRAVKAEIRKVIGHNGDSTHVLFNEERYDLGITQCPYEILNIREGKKDLYIRYWMKVDSAGMSQPYSWRVLFEYKTKGYAANNGFRLIAFIYTDNLGHPYWHWQGDKYPDHPVWEIDNRSIPVPLNEWFLTEFYWHWSNGSDGRALWKINGQIVGDHHGPTTLHSQPVEIIMLTQIYGNANPKSQWVDDIEIWDGLPE